MTRFVRAHLAANLVLVCVTATFSYAYFHIDENFQILEWAWLKLGLVEPWTLPMEHALRMRPWMQPAIYAGLGRALGVLGVHDTFSLAFAFRLATGLASFGALVLFVRAMLPLFRDEAEKRMFVRVATLLGFLPYLFVRTTSETLAMAAFTAAFAIACEGARQAPEARRGWELPSPSAARLLASGALLGVAFEARFQSAFLSVGLLAWLVVVARLSLARVALVGSAGAAVLLVGALVDRWGYGAWEIPAWNYLRANLVDGVATQFGSDPPFAYAWLLPANVFLPVVVTLMVLGVVAWGRNPWHPVTWATLPFFVVHNLLAHKEERFLFPLAILATAFVPMALGPSAERPARLARIAAFGWSRRRGAIAKVLAAWSTAFMVLLAVWPIGWNHHVRFQRYVNDALGGELRTEALPELDLGLPAFHGRVYDIRKSAAEDIARRLDDGSAREFLLADTPRLSTGVASLDARATLVWSELPCYRHPALTDAVMRVVDAYDAHARAPLRPIRFRSLYRLSR